MELMHYLTSDPFAAGFVVGLVTGAVAILAGS